MRTTKTFFPCLVLVLLMTVPFLPARIHAQSEASFAIPPEADLKAEEALKALGPDRGAKKISSREVRIVGATKAITVSAVEVQQAMRDLGAKESGMAIQIDLPGDVLFDFDSWDIRDEAQDTLAKAGTVIQGSAGRPLLITGHTDSKGSDAYNHDLSQKRAEAVAAWLVQNAGVAKERIEAKGCGETKPVAPNTNPDGSDNPDGRQKNRRVEITIEKQ